MRYGRFLNKNDCIGFVAPAFGCSFEPYLSGFNNAISKLKGRGYRTILGPNCYADCGIGISNSPEACGRELTEYYVNQDADLLISCGGGELMCEILDYVDFEAIKRAEPKWFLGYSDNTNFTFLSATLCDTAAIYGPCAAAFGMEPWHKAIKDCMELMEGRKLSFTGYDAWEKESLKSPEQPLAPYNTSEKSVIHPYPTDKFQVKGRLLGGCLDCLTNLTGTVYDRVPEFADRYGEDGILWFIEACDLNPMSIRRALWNLDHAGWFTHCSGFIIGRPLHFGEDNMGVDQYNAVTSVLGKYNVPILMDADLGHLPPAMPIICGSIGELTVEAGNYRLDMRLE